MYALFKYTYKNKICKNEKCQIIYTNNIIILKQIKTNLMYK